MNNIRVFGLTGLVGRAPGGGSAKRFSTHPPAAKWRARLEAMTGRRAYRFA